MLNDLIIYSERLKCVSLDMEHLNFFLDYYDDEAALYMDLISKGDKKEKTIEFIKQSIKELEEETDLHLILFNKYNDEFIGYIGIYFLKDSKPEIGIWISKKNQHRGYGIEATKCVIKWIKDNIEFLYIRYPVDRNNKFSSKIAEHFKGVIGTKYIAKSCTGRKLDIVEYWIL